jgi:hypothetical protein
MQSSHGMWKMIGQINFAVLRSPDEVFSAETGRIRPLKEKFYIRSIFILEQKTHQ